MAKLNKLEIQKLTNQGFAKMTNYGPDEITKAFENYNRLYDFIRKNTKLTNKEKIIFFLEKTESKELKELGIKRVEDVLSLGRLKHSIAELAFAKQVGFKTIENMVPALLKIELPEFIEEDFDENNSLNFKKNTTPRGHINVEDVIIMASSATTSITIPAFFSSLSNTKEKVKDTKEIAEGVKSSWDSIYGIWKQLRKDIKDAKRGTPPDVKKPGGEEPGMERKKDYGNITEDVYRELYGEALKNEPLYTVWIDRLMAFEVDYPGDDNVYWTAQVKTYLVDPPSRVHTSFISNIYDIDEREEYRLKPNNPKNGKREKPLADNEWSIRGSLENQDANLALRAVGDIRGIPLSKLDKIVIDIFLFESDNIDELKAAIAALGAATIASLGIINGKFTAPEGSTKELNAALKKAMDTLNELLNPDDKIFDDTFTIDKDDFEAAFRHGMVFDVPQRKAKAAIWLPYMRRGGGKLTSGGNIDTGEADDFFKEHKDELKKPGFWEDKFDSYYEFRLRFEREGQK